MGNIDGYTGKPTPKGGDEVFLIDQDTGAGKDKNATLDNLVTGAAACITQNTDQALGAIGTTFTQVAVDAEQTGTYGFTVVLGNNDLDLPQDGRYELWAQVSVSNDTGPRDFQARIAVDGSEAGDAIGHQGSWLADSRSQITMKTLYNGTAGEKVTVEVAHRGSPSTGILTVHSVTLYAKLVRHPDNS